MTHIRYQGALWKEYKEQYRIDPDGVYVTELFGSIDEVLRMRSSQEQYFQFLDLFGSAVVGVTIWKASRKARQPYQQILTVSDEAFIILCYDNYKECWMEDFNDEVKRKVNTRLVCELIIRAFIHTCRLFHRSSSTVLKW